MRNLSAESSLHRCKRKSSQPTSYTETSKTLTTKGIRFFAFAARTKAITTKKPANGIWGGLWCLPEIGVEVDVSAYCLDKWGIKIDTLCELPTLHHQFTHFKLRIYPKLLTTTSVGSMLQHDSIWLHPFDALQQGIPTPVRKIIKHTFASLKQLTLSINDEKRLERMA